MTLRCFIAVPISDTVRSALTGIQNELRKSCGIIKTVRPENLHITLVFLGNVREEELPQVRQIMDQTASRIAPFTCSVRGTGYFGRRKAPSVLWAGISKGDACPFSGIYSCLSYGLQQAGFKISRSDYSPHITLARLRSHGKVSGLVNLLDENAERDFGLLDVRHISLMHSDLRDGRPYYTALHESPLSG